MDQFFNESILDDQFRNCLQLHVRSAFIDRANLRITPKLLDRIILDVTITAVHLDRFRSAVQRYFTVPAGSPPEAFVEVADRYPVFELSEF